MIHRRLSQACTALGLLLLAAPLAAAGPPAPSAAPAVGAKPLVIGETFVLPSATLHEDRRINVYFPPGFSAASATALPVLYMPDGGLGEDFLHVAGLVQVSVGNGTLRPFLLVGIENTERRRDMTGPTEDPEDRKIAPRVGGSAAFRTFLRSELMPEIRKRYRTTAETAIVGESLAGLFVVETLLLEPDLFDTYLAFDPSLWWDQHRLLRQAASLLAAKDRSRKTLFLASSGYPDLAEAARRFELALGQAGAKAPRHEYLPMPEETHATIYHPAALRAFRKVLAPAPAPVP